MKQKIHQINYIKDPIYKKISFDQQWIVDLVMSEEMQRLKEIKQLGFLVFIFPHASHTRFSHSLGVYWLAKCFLSNHDIFTQNEKNELLAAALLHDLGHGPYSHFFEEITHENHENFSCQIILNKKTEVNKILQKNKISSKNVVAILKHKHKNDILNKLISSEIDFDRIDYLLRDTYFIKSKCKKIHFDKLFLNNIFIVKNQLCFDIKIFAHVKKFLKLRTKIYCQHCYNYYSLFLQSIMIEILKKFKTNYKKNKFNKNNKFLHYFKPWLDDKQWSINEYLKINDNIFCSFLNELKFEKDKFIQEGIKIFFNFNKKNYSFIPYTKIQYEKYLSIYQHPSLFVKYFDLKNIFSSKFSSCSILFFNTKKQKMISKKIKFNNSINNKIIFAKSKNNVKYNDKG